MELNTKWKKKHVKINTILYIIRKSTAYMTAKHANDEIVSATHDIMMIGCGAGGQPLLDLIRPQTRL